MPVIPAGTFPVGPTCNLAPLQSCLLQSKHAIMYGGSSPLYNLQSSKLGFVLLLQGQENQGPKGGNPSEEHQK